MKHWAIALTTWMSVASASVAALPRGSAGAQQEGPLLMQYIGNVVNGSPTAASSRQFGNLAAVDGADEGMSFTFFTEATTLSAVPDGPLRVIRRSGTTTVYLAASPGTFDDPDSFKSGTPVQVSTLDQQVIVDTTTGLFTVVNVNTITWAKELRSESSDLSLGQKGQSFRTVLTGRLNAPGSSPTGWFAGYATR
jgi:hypothetical protein